MEIYISMWLRSIWWKTLLMLGVSTITVVGQAGACEDIRTYRRVTVDCGGCVDVSTAQNPMSFRCASSTWLTR